MAHFPDTKRHAIPIRIIRTRDPSSFVSPRYYLLDAQDTEAIENVLHVKNIFRHQSLDVIVLLA